MSIPVIDLFSGPGGLGEGFASLDKGEAFKIVVSAETNQVAHATLLLRSYFRRVQHEQRDAKAYYDFCNGVTESPWNARTESAWKESADEAKQITLGTTEGNAILDDLLVERLKKKTECVLIGGPPCQAYSLAGRSRNKGIATYLPEKDHKHFLYKEYLRVIQAYRPAIFVMENVKGILSSRVGGRRIFEDILVDLTDPDAAVKGKSGKKGSGYKIYSLVAPTIFQRGMKPCEIDPADYVIRAEQYGIPQARHRVILLGVREDIEATPSNITAGSHFTVSDAIGDLPMLRSRLSKTTDSQTEWARVVRSHLNELAHDATKQGLRELAQALTDSAKEINETLDFGKLRLQKGHPSKEENSSLLMRLLDPKLTVILNHEARGHMSSDLRRYAFAATFAREFKTSPKGHRDFQLAGLRPNHDNWESGSFSDRFRVQLSDAPSTTVTSHISKDGHYFIHPDARQCRSLTVREAARLQTFQDNYFFQGNRTQQYHQVGNAVPPLLANQIAAIVLKLLG